MWREWDEAKKNNIFGLFTNGGKGYFGFVKQMRKSNSRADWWEARQMPCQRHPQGLGAGRWRPSQHNQLTQFDGSSENVEYDKAGNTLKMLPDKDGDWAEYYQLKWDGWNRLVEVKDRASAVVATYGYDGTTRRTTKTIGAVVRHYYYNDQWKPVEERVDAGTDAERQYAWGIQFRNDLILRDRDCPPAMRDDLQLGSASLHEMEPAVAAKQSTGNAAEGSPATAVGTLDERLYATHDALGNCTAILNTSGAVQERYGYSAFGMRRIMQADFSVRAASNFAWDFAFQGEFLDDETGYVNYGYRYYLPYVGRWINRDPIAEDGGNNLYLMVGNNAGNRIDYLGFDEGSRLAFQGSLDALAATWASHSNPRLQVEYCGSVCEKICPDGEKHYWVTPLNPGTRDWCATPECPSGWSKVQSFHSHPGFGAIPSKLDKDAASAECPECISRFPKSSSPNTAEVTTIYGHDSSKYNTDKIDNFDPSKRMPNIAPKGPKSFRPDPPADPCESC